MLDTVVSNGSCYHCVRNLCDGEWISYPIANDGVLRYVPICNQCFKNMIYSKELSPSKQMLFSRKII